MIEISNQRELANANGKDTRCKTSTKLTDAPDNPCVTLHYLVTHGSDSDGAGCCALLASTISGFGGNHVLIVDTPPNSGEATEEAMARAVEILSNMLSTAIPASTLARNNCNYTGYAYTDFLAMLNDDGKYVVSAVVLYVTDVYTSSADDDDPAAMHNQYETLERLCKKKHAKSMLVHIDHHKTNPYFITNSDFLTGKEVNGTRTTSRLNAYIRVMPGLYMNNRFPTGDKAIRRSASWLLFESMYSSTPLTRWLESMDMRVCEDIGNKNGVRFSAVEKFVHEISVHDAFAFKDVPIKTIGVVDAYAQYFTIAGFWGLVRRITEILGYIREDALALCDDAQPYGLIGVFSSNDLDVMHACNNAYTERAVTNISECWAIYKNTHIQMGIAVGDYNITPMSTLYFANTEGGPDETMWPEILVVVRACQGLRGQILMRSRGNVDVGDICKELGGGGHPGAAGATFNDSSEWLEVLNYLVHAASSGGINFDTLIKHLREFRQRALVQKTVG